MTVSAASKSPTHADEDAVATDEVGALDERPLRLPDAVVLGAQVDEPVGSGGASSAATDHSQTQMPWQRQQGALEHETHAADADVDDAGVDARQGQRGCDGITTHTASRSLTTLTGSPAACALRPGQRVSVVAATDMAMVPCCGRSVLPLLAARAHRLSDGHDGQRRASDATSDDVREWAGASRSLRWTLTAWTR